MTVLSLQQVHPEQVAAATGVAAEKVGLTIAMNSISGGFGFRIVGGRDIDAEMIPQVDLVAQGMHRQIDRMAFVCCHTAVS